MATPLIPFTLARLIGIWLASRIALPTLAFGIAAGVAIVGIILTWRAPKLRWVSVLALATVLGALRYNLAQPHFDQTSLSTFNDQQKSVIVEGIVVGEPDTRDAYTDLRVEVDHLLISDLPDGITRTVHSLVLIQAPPFSDFRYGDRMRAESKLQAPTDTGISRTANILHGRACIRHRTCGGCRCHVASARDDVGARSRLCATCMVVCVQGACEKRHRTDSRYCHF
jgi:hypothetical protein